VTSPELLCPVCCYEYVHPVALKVEPVSGDTVGYMNSGGLHTFASDAAQRIRGIRITTTFLCEQGHQWDEERAFHKGMTYQEAHRGPDWDGAELMPTTLGLDLAA
jgi:hypothetical protein